MKRSTKYILMIAGLFVVTVVAIVGYGVYSIYSTFRSFGIGREVPQELMEPRVTAGSDLFRKTEFFKLERSGWLEAFKKGSTISDDKEREKYLNSKVAAGIYNFADLKVLGDDIVAVAEFGAFVFDRHGNLKSTVILEPVKERVKIGPFETDTNRTDFDNLQIVRLDSQRIGFLSWDLSQGMRLFDADGSEIWSIGKKTVDLGALVTDSESEFERSTHVLEAAVGDLDGDGVSEYIVARTNDGIRVYDQSGTEKWFSPADFPSGELRVFDLDGDGKAELLVKGDAIRGADGTVIRKLKAGGDAFVLSETNNRGFEVRWADIYSGKLRYSSETGETLFQVDAPLSEIKKPAERVEVPGSDITFTDDSDNVAFPRAVLVSLRKDEPKYLAVIASFIGLPRSNFYVYDLNGRLVYHELLPEDAETIAVLPESHGVDSVLIGGKDTIWKYSVN